MRRSPPSLKRILVEAAILVLGHWILLETLSRLNVVEHLLAPGAGSRGALVVTTIFLLTRFVLLIIAPGWLLVRLWLWANRTPQRTTQQ